MNEPKAVVVTAPRRASALKLVLGAGLVVGLCALFAVQFASYARGIDESRAFVATSAIRGFAATGATPVPAAEVAPKPRDSRDSRESRDRADAGLDRASLNPTSSGFVDIPSTFSSSDGAYDLVIHFHGLRQLVVESFEHAGLNAVVATVNLGSSSAAYNKQFASRASLTALLDKVQSTVAKRGLRHARLRRLALSGFSAGYAAVRGVLSQPSGAERVDAVLLLDGIHTGYVLPDHHLDVDRLMSFTRFAEQATAGKKLFSITHSEIIPNGEYASTHESTDAVLAFLNLQRGPGGPAPALPEFPSMVNVGKLVPLAPLSEVHRGTFYLRGYAGTQKEDHMMHLAQMAETAVPDLVRFWSGSPTS